MTTPDDEAVDQFAARAAEWMANHLPPAPPPQRYRADTSDEEELAHVAQSRDLQRLIYDGGFAGICVPRAYGGLGLTVGHQAAFNRALEPYDYPVETQVPTFTPCMALLLEFGTEQQKRRHVPPMLTGETAWMQLLSEPSGGSDVAGALTSAVRDGDEWILNGSKIWTSGAWWADWGLCLVRTNWDVPKHRGLTVLMLEMRQPGIEIHRIEMLNGSREFCQEFLTDVRVSDDLRLGDVDDGWTVGTRWMLHERTVSGGSPYVSGEPLRKRLGSRSGRGAPDLLRQARDRGGLADPTVRELVGESHALTLVGDALIPYITEAIRAGTLSPHAVSITRLYAGMSAVRQSTIAFQLAGERGAAWADDEEDIGRVTTGFLMRQASCIGGGTTEISRNVISERVLGMPREQTLDRATPFREVPKNAPGR